MLVYEHIATLDSVIASLPLCSFDLQYMIHGHVQIICGSGFSFDHFVSFLSNMYHYIVLNDGRSQSQIG